MEHVFYQMSVDVTLVMLEIIVWWNVSAINTVTVKV
jgi:hypothetical protein